MTSEEILRSMAEDTARGTTSARREYGSGYSITGGRKRLSRWELRQIMLAAKRDDRRVDAILKQWRKALREAAEAPVERGPTPISPDNWRDYL